MTVFQKKKNARLSSCCCSRTQFFFYAVRSLISSTSCEWIACAHECHFENSIAIERWCKTIWQPFSYFLCKTNEKKLIKHVNAINAIDGASMMTWQHPVNTRSDKLGTFEMRENEDKKKMKKKECFSFLLRSDDSRAVTWINNSSSHRIFYSFILAVHRLSYF